MARILIFGASTTYGAWDKEGGWADRLKRWIHQRTLEEKDFYSLAYNLGVSGDTTADILERFEFETKMRLKEGEETMFIIAVGVNDSQFIHSKNGLRSTPDEYQENLQKLIGLAKKFSSSIVIIGTWPMDETKTSPIPWAPDESYKNKYLQEFNDMTKAVCMENGIHFIDLFGEWSKIDYKHFLSDDGVHPNTEGHKRIFELVRNFLIEKKII